MKKLIVLSVAALMVGAAIHAQSNEESVKNDITGAGKQETLNKKQKREMRKLEANEASYQAREQFYRDFGNIDGVEWSKGNNFDEAIFIKDGKPVTAYYDYKAELVGTTTNKSFDDLPAKARDYINKKYSGYSKGDVFFFDDNELNETDMVLFNQPFADEDNYFLELKNDKHKIILQINMEGDVSYFSEIF